METTLNLKRIVQQSMSDLIAAHSLKLVEISDMEVLLQSDIYAIDVVADMDGVSLLYFDTTQKPAKGYNLFLFLFNKRRDALIFSTNKPQTTSYIEFVESELNSLVQHVRNAGEDILGGSREWIKNYSWPALRPSGGLASLI